MSLISQKEQKKLLQRKRKAVFFSRACAFITWSSVLLLGVLLYQVSADGFVWLDWQFISSFPSRFPERAGIKSALVGTFWLISLVAVISIPVGVSSALYLEEFARPGRLNKFIEVNISNLAGVPSIVYGILGLAIFVRFFCA